MRFRAMRYPCASLIVLALGTFSSAKRQEPLVGQDQQPKPGITNAAKRAVLKEGTEVHLKLAQTMTSKTSSVGEPVEMVLAEDLKEQAGVGKRDKDKMVTYSILFGLSGLLAASNKTFVIPEGTSATAYVQEDISLPILPASSNVSQ